MNTSKQDREIDELDPWSACDYFQALDLGATHDEAISLANNLDLFTEFLEQKNK